MVVCAGNVLTFLAPATRRDVLANLGGQLFRDDGRIAVGFGAGRGYDFDEFRSDGTSWGWSGSWSWGPGTCARSPRTATSSWRSSSS